MSRTDTLIAFIQNCLVSPSQTIEPSTLLFQSHLLDSINILPLIGWVEQQLGRRLTDEELVMVNFESPIRIIQAFFNRDDTI